MTTRLNRLTIPTLLLSLLPACGEQAEPEAGGSEAQPTMSAEPSVSVVSPADASEVMGPDVTVELAVTGMRILPAGDMTAGTGHHHLYLDAELTPADQPVPTVPGSIVHIGTGDSVYTFQGVQPGEHRLIAVVADGLHVPLQPWVVDTVNFTVR